MNLQHVLQTLSATLLLSSCAYHEYIEPKPESDISSLYLVNMTIEVPHLYISQDCKKPAKISKEYVNNASVSAKNRRKLDISAGTATHLKYGYYGIVTETEFLDQNTQVTGASETGLDSIGIGPAKITKQKNLESCESSVHFLPLKSRSYHAHFGYSEDKCYLKIYEKSTSKVNRLEEIQYLKTSKIPKC